MRTDFASGRQRWRLRWFDRMHLNFGISSAQEAPHPHHRSPRAYARHKSIGVKPCRFELGINLRPRSRLVRFHVGVIGELPRQENARVIRGVLLRHPDAAKEPSLFLTHFYDFCPKASNEVLAFAA